MNIQLSGTDFNYAEEKSEHSEKRTYFRQDLIVALQVILELFINNSLLKSCHFGPIGYGP